MFHFLWGAQPPRSKCHQLFLCLVMALLLIPDSSANIQNPHDEIRGVVGDMSRLQCKALQHRIGRNPVLVLWYKDGARLPFFTLDLRNEGPEQFFDNDEMKSRVNSDVTGEFLTLRSLIASDSAQYKCKVDYDNSPSLEATVNLIVFEPPTQISIQDESKRIYPGPVLGPINQESSLRLFCIAVGGNPTPQVSWSMGSTLLTDRSYNLGAFLASQEEDLIQDPRSSVSSNTVSSSSFSLGPADGEHINAPRVVSELNIAKITRNHAGANITCRASNNNISKPLVKVLSLNVYLRPATVDIISPKEPLREGVPTRLQCQTAGSYPSAKITWEKTKNGKPVVLEPTQTSFRDGKSIAWLNFTPEADDNGAMLACLAHNPDLPGRGMQKSTNLQVQFAPRVNLQLGKNLVHQAIKEGEDVYFECEIASNPRPKSITWHNGAKQVEQDLRAGVLLSGENLVLQRIHRKYAGNYTCTAANDLGVTTSNVVELPVMFLPVCSTDLVTVAVAEGEGVRLNCRVEARPSDLLRYIWLFNNTMDTVEVGADRIKVENGISYIDYTPLSQRDYGTLSCWATNEVGMQAEPCRFLVAEAGSPESVKNCVLVNHTVGALEVRCSPGNDGGSPQRFVAKVFAHASPTNVLLAELESPSPRFHVAGLTPGQDYQITVTAVNSKGASAPEEIDAIRLKVAEKRMGDVKSPPVSPLVGVFLGLVGGFVLLLLVGLLLSRARSNRSSCWRPRTGVALGGSSEGGGSQALAAGVNMGDNALQKTPAHMHTHVSSSSISRAMQDEDEESPDLVKSSNETSQLLDSRKCPDMITSRHNYTPTGGPLSSPLGRPNLSPFLDPQSPRHLPSDESFV